MILNIPKFVIFSTGINKFYRPMSIFFHEDITSHNEQSISEKCSSNYSPEMATKLGNFIQMTFEEYLIPGMLFSNFTSIHGPNIYHC